MNLDNEPVNRNDSVYDIIFGAGIVMTVATEQISVRFGDNATRAYKTGGIGAAFRVRTLYWGDPLAGRAPPDKNPARRAQKRAVAEYVEAALDAAYRM